MLQVPLLAIPNQSFTTTLGNHNWLITIKQGASDTTLLSATVDNQVLIESLVCHMHVPMLLEGPMTKYGNLMFSSPVENTDGYPEYLKFNTEHFLYYIEPEA